MKHPPRAWRKAARRLRWMRYLRADRIHCSLEWWASKIRATPDQLRDAEAARVDPRPWLRLARCFCPRCGSLSAPGRAWRDAPYLCGVCQIEMDELWDEED